MDLVAELTKKTSAKSYGETFKKHAKLLE